MQKNNAREQIIAKLKESDNILITVSNNPSVDELSAALALTLAINKTGKHATAVASGKMPDALEFLNPNKTFENSVDSLRDFIIALNKDKADHLRYKLVGDYVKIFITPYKTTLTKDDLEFEQGDFNIDFVLALGVTSQDHLDGALTAHGRIFHDASVGVLTVGETSSNLSELNWHSEIASSLSEMALELIDSDSIGKKSLTKSVSTAILTGIVAETERFSNEKANAKVMNLASKLILAGADQQLIVSKLKESEDRVAEINLRKEIEDQSKNFENGTNKLEEVENLTEETKPKQPKKKDANILTIEREDSTPDNELDNYLDEMSAKLSDSTTKSSNEELDPELAKIADLAVDFPATRDLSAPNVPEIDNTLGDHAEEKDQIKFEETPAKSYVENTEESTAEVIAPIENYAPEISLDNPEIEQDSAFISEQPINSQTFEPAQQVDISLPQEENSTQNQMTPANSEPKQDQVSVQPKFGAQDYMTDEYYQPEQARRILEHNPEDQPIINGSQPETAKLSTEDNAYYNQKTIDPLASTTNSAPKLENDQSLTTASQPVMPPAPDFNTMPMPPELPPVPDFSNINFGEIPAPAPILSNPPSPSQPAPDPYEANAQAVISAAQTPQPAPVGQGTSASANNIMIDQVYQDPSQFKIPGM